MTERTRAAELEILASHIAAPVAQIARCELNGFLALEGARYDRELMVVGRAVNKWLEAISPRLLANETERRSFLAGLEAVSYPPDTCPMAWVHDQWGTSDLYNTRRSAFWRVSKRVLEGVTQSLSEVWSSHLVWSNLYKIAPAAGGNPDGSLQQAQFEGCVELLKVELDRYRPRRLLFLTGLNWARPFLSSLGFEPFGEDLDRRFVEAVGATGETRWVIAQHPMGKNEDVWVREVIEAFARGES